MESFLGHQSRFLTVLGLRSTGEPEEGLSEKLICPCATLDVSRVTECDSPKEAQPGVKGVGRPGWGMRISWI